MSLLEQIRSGPRHSPPRLLIYGTEGIGKSTTASQAHRPIFIPTEDGLDQIDWTMQFVDKIDAYELKLKAEKSWMV